MTNTITTQNIEYNGTLQPNQYYTLSSDKIVCSSAIAGFYGDGNSYGVSPLDKLAALERRIEKLERCVFGHNVALDKNMNINLDDAVNALLQEVAEADHEPTALEYTFAANQKQDGAAYTYTGSNCEIMGAAVTVTSYKDWLAGNLNTPVVQYQQDTAEQAYARAMKVVK